MPSIRYLESVWEPGDAALSVGNPAVYHAPDPARFHYIRSRRFGLDRLRRRLAGGRHDYNYVVGRVEDRAGLLELFEGARVVHSDGSFFVARTD